MEKYHEMSQFTISLSKVQKVVSKKTKKCLPHIIKRFNTHLNGHPRHTAGRKPFNVVIQVLFEMFKHQKQDKLPFSLQTRSMANVKQSTRQEN